MRLSVLSPLTPLIAILGLSLCMLSCEQYQYTSPDPGVIEVKLKVVNNRQDLLPFTSFDSLTSPQNGLYVTMTSLDATQPGDIRLPIYSDLNAIRRNPDGDAYNCLDTSARDSLVVLGETYAPPETFTGLELSVTAPGFVFISYGFYGSLIPVDVVRPYFALQQLPGTIPVESGRKTRVTVTFDLDASLIQLTESFLFKPVFYISSVEIL